MKKLLRFSLCGCIALISSALPTPAQIQNGVPFRDAGVTSASAPAGASAPVGASAPAGAHLSYFGGPIVSKPQIIQVLYGGGSYNLHVAGTSIPTMGNFFTDLLGTNSGYIPLLQQYGTVFSGGTNQGITNGTFNGLFTINPSAANNAELLAQINAGGLPAPVIGAQGNVNTIYMIYFPPGKTITAGGDQLRHRWLLRLSRHHFKHVQLQTPPLRCDTRSEGWQRLFSRLRNIHYLWQLHVVNERHTF
jgi:hypothetical protein